MPLASGPCVAGSLAAAPSVFSVGCAIEVVGLQSEYGKVLNGKHGRVGQFVEATGRYSVDLGIGKATRLRGENLRNVEPEPAPVPTWAPCSTAPGTSLLRPSIRVTWSKRDSLSADDLDAYFSMYGEVLDAVWEDDNQDPLNDAMHLYFKKPNRLAVAMRQHRHLVPSVDDGDGQLTEVRISVVLC